MKLSRKITAILLMGLLVLGLAGCGSSQKREYIHFAATAENPPFAFVNTKGFFGQYDGIDMELVKIIAVENNYMPAIENMEATRYLAALQNDQAEVAIGAITAEDESLKDAEFTHAYYDATQVGLVKEGTELSGIDDLKDKRLCVVEGFFDEKALQAAGLTFETVEKGSEAIVKLTGGDCDVVLADASLAQIYAKKNAGLTISDGDGMFAEKKYVAAVKKGNTSLAEKINAVIDAMLADGRMEEAILKYADGADS